MLEQSSSLLSLDELAKYQNQPELNIADLANTLYIKLKDRYQEAVSVLRGHMFPVVQSILCRQQIRLQDTIPGTNLRWEFITASGLIWVENTCDTDYDTNYESQEYLVAPYIWLWILARLPTSENKDVKHSFCETGNSMIMLNFCTCKRRQDYKAIRPGKVLKPSAVPSTFCYLLVSEMARR